MIGGGLAGALLAGLSFAMVNTLTGQVLPLATWHLGQGESEVLEYARRNSGTVAVLDDKAARRLARALDIPLTGTLGIIVAAVQMKLLPSFSAAIGAVRACGLYVDSATVACLLAGDVKERS